MTLPPCFPAARSSTMIWRMKLLLVGVSMVISDRKQGNLPSLPAGGWENEWLYPIAAGKARRIERPDGPRSHPLSRWRERAGVRVARLGGCASDAPPSPVAAAPRRPLPPAGEAIARASGPPGTVEDCGSLVRLARHGTIS